MNYIHAYMQYILCTPLLDSRLAKFYRVLYNRDTVVLSQSPFFMRLVSVEESISKSDIVAAGNYA